jgi:hypothetical protein
MAIPTKGTRRIIVDGVTYRWRVIYDRLHWDKGYITDVRIVVQAVPPGQLLVADFMASRRQGGNPLSQPFTPAFARKLILGGLARGWMPRERINQPILMEEEEVSHAAWTTITPLRNVRRGPARH